MKKITLVLIGMLVVLAGCGSNDDTSSKGETSKGISVSVDDFYADWMQQIADDFTTETGYPVEIIQSSMTDMLPTLKTQQDKAPDVILMPSDGMPSYVESKILQPLDTEVKDFSDTAISASQFDGETYLLPTSVETTVLFYNKDLVDESELPTAMSDLAPEEWLADFTQPYYYSGLLASKGGYFFGGSEHNDITDLGANTEGGIEAATIAQDLYQNGGDNWSLMQEADMAVDISENAFKNGDIPFIIDGNWAIDSFTDAGVNFGIMPIPGWEEGETWQQLVSTKGFVINAYSDNSEVAQEFVNFINQTKYAQSLVDMVGDASPNTEVDTSNSDYIGAISEAAAQGIAIPVVEEFAVYWLDFPETLKQIATGEDPTEALQAGYDTMTYDIEEGNLE